METLFGRLSATYRIVRTTFGRYVGPIFVGGAFLTLRLWTSLALLVDPLVFPSYRRAQVRRPIILVGNPRTGTTFLQRWLSDNGIGAGIQLWRMVYPSLTIQFFLRPFLPLLEYVSPAKYHSSAAHETSLSSVETDDVGALFRNFDGFFLYGFFLAFDEQDHRSSFDPKFRDTSERDFAWFRQLWRRNIAWTGQDRVVAKLFSLGPRLPKFLAEFPDAFILYMVRDPVEVIPSAMSLVTGVLHQVFKFWDLPEDIKRRYCERLYLGLVDLLRTFHDDWVSGAIDRKRVYVVRYDRMMREFDVVMGEMLKFLEVEPDAKLQAEIATRTQKQRKHKSDHKYDLAKFYLTEEQVRRDCAFVYDTFLTPLPPLADEAQATA
jgi:omega-hydroxy-beta-dihydromenaquinone-9 sulfotransferase